MAILPSTHILHITEAGKILKPTCGHDLIPGLDASFCEECRIWWIDGYETVKFRERKKLGINPS